MIVLLSPAKRLNYTDPLTVEKSSQPLYVEESTKLITALKKLSQRKIKSLMKLNDNLAELNYERYQNWKPEFNSDVARQAILTFKGDAYLGLNAVSYSEEDFQFAQDHLRILSGLHGLLKPLDLIRPYRLEMGTKLKVGRANNLYDFWKNKVSESIANEQAFQADNTIINLASAEYFKVVKPDLINSNLITPEFKEFRNGNYKPVHIFLKKARGMMVSYIVKNRLKNPEEIKLFDWEGYSFNDNLSKDKTWVFTRG